MTNREWGGLRSIVEEAKDLDRERREHVDPDCPVCGTPLDVRPRDGVRNCPMGHYSDNGRPGGGN